MCCDNVLASCVAVNPTPVSSSSNIEFDTWCDEVQLLITQPCPVSTCGVSGTAMSSEAR